MEFSKTNTAVGINQFCFIYHNLIISTSFVINFYVDGHKLNYAIERALGGIPAKTSVSHLVLPIIIYGSIASIIGGFF